MKGGDVILSVLPASMCRLVAPAEAADEGGSLDVKLLADIRWVFTAACVSRLSLSAEHGDLRSHVIGECYFFL